MTEPLEPPRRHADPRLAAYLVAGFGTLLIAVATGQADLAALGAPFLVLAALGAGQRAPEFRFGLKLDRERVVEGDTVHGEIHLQWAGEAEVDVMLVGWRGVRALEPTPVVGWSLPAQSGAVALPFRMKAQSWGRHALGTVWIRFRSPGGLVVWEQQVGKAPALRVLPNPLRLDRLLQPTEPHAVSGFHLSRIRDRGTDFAELRPYQPGDRLRDLSWATSARFGAPWVRVHHPERTGTVLMLFDAFWGDEPGSAEALARAARTTWAVASVHLRVQDRVGLLALGHTAAWLAPRGGRRARWQLIDTLLMVGGAAEDVWLRRGRRSRVVVPADALVIGVTSLRSRALISDLLHYRRTGHATVALVIDTHDLLPEGEGLGHRVSKRVWAQQRDADQHRLDVGGVPTALVTAADGVGPAMQALRRRMEAYRNPVRGVVGAGR